MSFAGSKSSFGPIECLMKLARLEHPAREGKEWLPSYYSMESLSVLGSHRSWVIRCQTWQRAPGVARGGWRLEAYPRSQYCGETFVVLAPAPSKWKTGDLRRSCLPLLWLSGLVSVFVIECGPTSGVRNEGCVRPANGDKETQEQGKNKVKDPGNTRAAKKYTV